MHPRCVIRMSQGCTGSKAPPQTLHGVYRNNARTRTLQTCAHSLCSHVSQPNPLTSSSCSPAAGSSPPPGLPAGLRAASAADAGVRGLATPRDAALSAACRGDGCADPGGWPAPPAAATAAAASWWPGSSRGAGGACRGPAAASAGAGPPGGSSGAAAAAAAGTAPSAPAPAPAPPSAAGAVAGAKAAASAPPPGEGGIDAARAAAAAGGRHGSMSSTWRQLHSLSRSSCR